MDRSDFGMVVRGTTELRDVSSVCLEWGFDFDFEYFSLFSVLRFFLRGPRALALAIRLSITELWTVIRERLTEGANEKG